MANYSKPNLKSKTPKVFDLEERTGIFGENIIEICKSLSKNAINLQLKVAQALERIIWKLMEQNLEKILNIKLLFVKKKQKKQNIG